MQGFGETLAGGEEGGYGERGFGSGATAAHARLEGRRKLLEEEEEEWELLRVSTRSPVLPGGKMYLRGKIGKERRFALRDAAVEAFDTGRGQ